MPSSKKTTKEDIIKASFEILKEQGIEKVTARDLAKKLNSSVQPIFYQFKNMDDLKKELLKYSLEYYHEYISKTNENNAKYKEIGKNYIKFAKEETNIFKLIFMGDYHIKIDNFREFDPSYKEIEQILEEKYKITKEEVRKFHLKMWMFTHGIACLIATRTCDFSDKEISKLLTEEFTALIKNI